MKTQHKLILIKYLIDSALTQQRGPADHFWIS